MLESEGKLPIEDNKSDVFFILDNSQLHRSLLLVENVRQELPALKIDMDLKFGSFKSQFKKADKSDAKIAVIIGQDELLRQTVGVKYLQQDKQQEQIPLNKLINFLEKIAI